MFDMLRDNEHRTGVSKVLYGMFERLGTVWVRVEYCMGVTVQGEGGGTPFKGICCKEWAVTINPITTLENSINFAFSTACL